MVVPPPLPSRQRSGHGGVSKSTQYSLIALGSIGAAIAVFIIGWLIYRKTSSRHLSKSYLLRKRDRYKTIKEVTPPLGRWSAVGHEWDQKQEVNAEEVRKRTEIGTAWPLQIPPAVLTRSESVETLRRTRTPVIPSPISSRRLSSTIDEAEHEHQTAQPPSVIASSDILATPALTVGGTHTTHVFTPSSLPAYLKGVADKPVDPMETSRFSWTDSQSPKTPATQQTRYSVASSRSSVPRFRTIDSWVGHQAQSIKKDEEEDKVPEMPEKYRRRTNMSEATIFRHHPGIEVIVPRGSLVPSEVLDQAASKRRTGASF